MLGIGGGAGVVMGPETPGGLLGFWIMVFAVAVTIVASFFLTWRERRRLLARERLEAEKLAEERHIRKVA